ncbi:RNA-binding protein [Trichinella pseudospiralis]
MNYLIYLFIILVYCKFNKVNLVIIFNFLVCKDRFDGKSCSAQIVNLENQILPHHRFFGFCKTRPFYRRGKRETAVKVFTVSSESKYLLIQKVPSLNVGKELINRCENFGVIEKTWILPDYPCDPFTEAHVVCYRNIVDARRAKRFFDNLSFYGSLLHVSYAPEYESVDETEQKLILRNKEVETRSKLFRLAFYGKCNDVRTTTYCEKEAKRKK